MHRLKKAVCGGLTTLVFSLTFPCAALAAPRTDQHYRAGVGMLAKGLNDLAEKELRAYLAENPDGPDAPGARYSLGVCLVRLGRHAEADAELASVNLKDFQFAPDALLLRAQCAATTGNDQKAAEHLDALARGYTTWDRLPQALTMLSETRYRLGDMPGAAQSAARVTDEFAGDPSAARAMLIRAMAESGLGKHQDALRHAGALRERDPKGPGAAAAALIQARSLQQLKRDDEAVEAYEFAARAAEGTTRTEAHFGLAACAIAKGDWVGARKALDAIDRADPAVGERVEDLHARMEFDRLSATGIEAEQSQAALTEWTEWRKRFRGHALEGEALLAQAWCAHRAGKFVEADQYLSKLEDRFVEQRDGESAMLLVAENAYAGGNFDGALKAYTALRENHPGGVQYSRAGLRAAMCLAHRGSLDEADRVLAAAGDDPNADAALRQAAAMLLVSKAMEARDYARGERWARVAASDSGPVAMDALLRMGICMQRQGKHQEAVTVFERVVGSGASGEVASQAIFERGQSQMELDQMDDARTSFEELLKRPDDGGRFAPHATRHLATIASRQGRASDASKLLGNLAQSDAGGSAAFDFAVDHLAAGRFEEAAGAFEAYTAASKDPALTRKAALHRATALNHLGRHQEALQVVDAAAPNAREDPSLRSEVEYTRGIALNALGRAEDAERAFSESASSESSRSAPYAALELARMSMDKGDFEAAAARADACMAAASRSDSTMAEDLLEAARYVRASGFARAGRHAEAEQAAREFLAEHAGSAMVFAIHATLGEALAAQGLHGEAAAEFELAAAPSAAPELAQATLLAAAESWGEAQEWSKCEQASRRFLERFPDSDQWFRARFNLGWSLENSGRHERAIEAYREVSTRHTGATAARAQFQIGECLYAMKRHSEAVAEFVKTDLLHAEPRWSAAALYEAGRCLREQDREADARAQFDELIKRFPDSEWARLARAEVDPPSPPRRSANAPAQAE